MLDEKLDGVDKIIDNFSNSRLSCIFTKLSKIDDNLYCTSFSNFTGETKIDLQFNTGYIGQPLAVTSNLPTYPSYVNITFNLSLIDDFCDVVLASTMLHEGIHAEIMRQNITGSEMGSKVDIWNNWNNSNDDHNNIANVYLPEIIASLKAIYGSTYSDIEYEAIAWAGLGNVLGDPKFISVNAWNQLPESRKQQLQNAFSSVNSKCPDNDCD